LIKDVFLASLQRTASVKKISDLVCLSPLLTFADALVFVIELPAYTPPRKTLRV
jgi:hypothetical protein